jgi:hypothetical protein
MTKSDRIALLAEQVTARIRPYCQHMTEEELRSLARSMAAIERKYAVSDYWPCVPS